MDAIKPPDLTAKLFCVPCGDEHESPTHCCHCGIACSVDDEDGHCYICPPCMAEIDLVTAAVQQDWYLDRFTEIMEAGSPWPQWPNEEKAT